MIYNFDPFTVDYGSISFPVGSFKEECVLAVENISQETGSLPIVVMMSGGIDSELVAESLLLAGVEFKCVIGRLYTQLGNERLVFNSLDYVYASRWCLRHNVEILYCDIDIYKETNRLCEYAISAKTFSPQYACHMYIMKWCNDNGYFFLAGNGEMDLVLHNGSYHMMDEQREFSLANFCQLNSLKGCFQFWKQDGRLISSFLKLPTVAELIKNSVPSILEYKHKCFSDILEFEDRKKQTGFEKIQEWDAHLRNYLKRVNGHFDSKFYTPISQFIE